MPWLCLLVFVALLGSSTGTARAQLDPELAELSEDEEAQTSEAEDAEDDEDGDEGDEA